MILFFDWCLFFFSKESSSKYEEKVQKGIEAAKNQLKASLTTAINDLKDAPKDNQSSTKGKLVFKTCGKLIIKWILSLV